MTAAQPLARPGISRRRSQDIAAWAAHLGQAGELGQLLGCYQQRSASGLRGLGFVMVAVGVVPVGLLGLADVAGSAVPLSSRVGGLAWLAAAAALISVGAVLALTRRGTTDWIFAYEGGIVQDLESDREPRVIPWSLLGHTEKKQLRSSESNARDGVRMTVTGPGQTRITFDDGYDRVPGLGSGPELLGLEQYLDAVVVAMRLPDAIAAARRGAEVQFGPVTVSLDGLAWDDGRKRALWPDVKGVFLLPPLVVRITTGAWPRPDVDLDGVPDPAVAYLLIQEVMRLRGVNQYGHRAVVPPLPRPS
jgi:hypothetical protein